MGIILLIIAIIATGTYTWCKFEEDRNNSFKRGFKLGYEMARQNIIMLSESDVIEDIEIETVSIFDGHELSYAELSQGY